MAVDPLWSDVVLALSCDAPLVDRKGNTLNIPANTSVQIGGKFSSHATFATLSGEQHIVAVKGSPSFLFGTSDFTIDMWINVVPFAGYTLGAALPGSRCTLIRKGWSGASGGTDDFGSGMFGKLDTFALRLLKTGHPQFTACEDGVTNHVTLTSSVSLDSYAGWTHIQLVRYGTTFTLYINGVATGSATSSTAVSGYIGHMLQILNVDNNSGAQGSRVWQIDDVRITRAARNTGDFTPPTSAFTGSVFVPPAPTADPYAANVVVGMHFDVTPVVDTLGHTVANGLVSLKWPIYSRFGTAAQFTNGGTGGPRLLAHTDFALGSGNFTIDFWAATFYQNTVFLRQAWGPGLFDSFEFGFDLSNGITLRMSSNGYDPDVEILTGAWPARDCITHYEIVRNGTTVTVYMDGVSIGSGYFSLGLGASGTKDIQLGPVDYPIIDELRITKGIARHTGNFTPPTEPGSGWEISMGGTGTAALTAPKAKTTSFLGATAAPSAPSADVSATAFPSASTNIATIKAPKASITATATNIYAAATAPGAGASAPLTMPKPTVSAASSNNAPGAASVDVTCPVPRLSAAAHDSTGENGLSYTMAAPALEAHGGGNARLSLAKPTLEATMSIVIVGNAALKSPSPTLDATATVSGMATAALTLRKGSFDVVGYSGAVVSVTIGKSTVQATATLDGVARAAVKLPLFELSATGHTDNFGSAALLMPAAELGRQLQAWIAAPSAMLTAVGSAVVTATYEAYAVNLNHTPRRGVEPVDETTRYTNFPFTHVVRYQNSYYGANSTGLYLLEGTTDAGTAIPWAVKTAMTDFDSPTHKTVASAYFGGRLGPAATVTLHAGEGAQTQAYSYTTPRGALAQNYRQVFGKGIRKHRYYALAASGSGAFELDDIDLDVVNLSRRI